MKFKLYLILIFLIFSTGIYAENVNIEIKKYGEIVFFVFYHNKDTKVSCSYKDNEVRALFPSNIEINLLNNDDFFNLVNRPLVKDKFTLSFRVKDQYEFIKQINGEKLTAVQLKIIKNNTNITEKKTDIVEKNKFFSINLTDFKTKNLAVFPNGKYLWIVSPDDSIKWESGNFKCSRRKDLKNATVIYCDVNKYQVQNISEKHGALNISLAEIVNDSAIEKDSLISNIDMDNLENSMMLYLKSDGDLIQFYDENLGNRMVVKTVPIFNLGVKNQQNFIDFTILKSHQGLAASILNDDLKVTNHNDGISILNEAYTKASILEYDDNKTILPLQQGDSKLMAKIADLQSKIITPNISKSEIYTLRSQIARLYFASGFYHEASAILNVMQIYNNSIFINDFYSNFLQAVTLSIINRNLEAENLYKIISKKFDNIPAELYIWQQYNNYVLEKDFSNIDILPVLNKFLKQYSNELYWKLVLASIDVALVNNDLSMVESLLANTRLPKSLSHTNSINFYKATLNRKQNNIKLAAKLYSDLLNYKEDKYNFCRTELDFVKMLYETKNINVKNAINRLSDIRYVCHGFKMEYDLLLTLADYYRISEDSINALRVFSYIKKNIPNQKDSFHLSSEISGIFNKIFAQNGLIDEMDSFDSVSLYYEFKDFIPIGSKGDELILSIAKKMLDLDLFEETIKLLEHQIQYRLRDKDKVITATHLAMIYLINKEPSKAIKILSYTDNENLLYNEHQIRLRLKAKAYFDLKNYSKAASYIKNDNSEDAILLKKEIYFVSNQWNNYIKLMESTILTGIKESARNDNYVLHDHNKQDILRLAISYSMLGLYEKLSDLNDILGKNETHTYLKKVINFLSISGGNIDISNLGNDELLNINQMEELIENYKKKLFNYDTDKL